MRKDVKERELKILYEEYKKDPSLFERQTFVEDDKILEQFGIHIPDKEYFPKGYLKLAPSDFIVEETLSNNEVCTVDYENILTPNTTIEIAGPTIYATLVKCGISTIEAIDDLVQQLKCDKTQIQFAGIKDKDAITAQRLSFRSIPLENLKRVSSPYFFLKDVSSGKGAVEKGGLKGNRFTILIRTENTVHESHEREKLIERLKQIQANGFYNFYYLQRFGTPRLINFYWGLEIIKGNYREAIQSFMTYAAPRELPYFQTLRRKVEECFGDWPVVKKILEPFPLIFYNEHKVVDYLERHPDDYRGALRIIQDQTTLWVYAFSSLLFNERLSSYARSDKEPPSSLPLLLSNNQRDIEIYHELLSNIGIFPPPLSNLARTFPFIRLQKRDTPTKEHVDLHKVEVTEHGIVLSFTLLKGDYATTFLAHLFNLMSDKVPNTISTAIIDIKSALGEKAFGQVLEHFQSVIHSKADNIFDSFK